MSLNLHDIVRPAIEANLQDQPFELYRACDLDNEEGIVTSYYEHLTGFKGNFQSEGDATLDHAELAAQNTIIRRLYLYAPDDRAQRAWSIYRPLSRSGDYIKDKNGDLWLVVAVLEDFSEAGWECLRIQLQQEPVQITLKTDESGEESL